MAIVLPGATFLHIPKCGGTWVVQALTAAGLEPQVVPPGGQHAIAATEGRFVFTFVRHPLTWYASFWNFRRGTAARPGGSAEERLREDARQAAEPIDECLVDERGSPRDFVAFVEACVARHPGSLSQKYELYAQAAHFVGRQESLVDDLLTALGRAGVAFDAESIRRTRNVNEADPRFPAVYPAKLAVRLLASEAAAVERFYRDAARWPTPG
jgi:hypothetical protein